ncbi:prophage integrase (pseudogene) [Salmonella enterica subsp. enterica]|nr:prophage integrase (pseudogene) [Salmonella enterica subsp. enterica]
MPALHPSELGRLMLALQNASIRKENPLPYRMGATDLGSPRRGRQRPLVRHRHEKKQNGASPDTFMKDEPFAHGAA